MTLKRFQFERKITYEIDPDSMKDLIDTLKIKSIEELESLIPDGPREASNEASYKKVEQIFLPNIMVELFWDNFNDPGIIFKDRDFEDPIYQQATELKDGIKKNSIDYLALWDGEDENNKSLEITLSTQCELEIVDDPNIERALCTFEEIEGVDLEEEDDHCSEMFTFSLGNLEQDEDEVWENEWMILKNI